MLPILVQHLPRDRSGWDCGRCRWLVGWVSTLTEYRELEVGELNITTDVYERIIDLCGGPKGVGSVSMKVLQFQTSVTATSSASPPVVYETVTDLKAHLVWSGERASDDGFKLLSLEGPDGPAGVGTTFSSTGANFNGTFHDRSVVTEASPPSLFVIQTEARLERKRGKPWEVQFIHRYDIEPDGDGSRITYTDTTHRMNYVPYWLKTPLRPFTRAAIRKGDTQQLTNLARLAEERES